jgi:hypothetical protein
VWMAFPSVNIPFEQLLAGRNPDDESIMLPMQRFVQGGHRSGIPGKIREFENSGKIRELSGNLTKNQGKSQSGRFFFKFCLKNVINRQI